MNIQQISDRYTYLKESSIKHNKNYLFSKKGKYFFDENLSIYYHSSINTLTKYNTDKKESIAIKPSGSGANKTQSAIVPLLKEY